MATKPDHRRLLTRRAAQSPTSRKHGHPRKIAGQDRNIVASDFALIGFKPGLLCDFHCRFLQCLITKAFSPMRYHHASSAISRPQAKYNFTPTTSVICFTPEQ
jgi:hypothetical protein